MEVLKSEVLTDVSHKTVHFWVWTMFCKHDERLQRLLVLYTESSNYWLHLFTLIFAFCL